MNDYEKTVFEYRDSLEKTRKIIVNLVTKLEDIVENYDDTNSLSHVWGDKENVVSSLAKLTGLLVKVVPMEKQLLDSISDEGKTSNVERIINSDDKEIIKRFIKKYKIDDD